MVSGTPGDGSFVCPTVPPFAQSHRNLDSDLIDLSVYGKSEWPQIRVGFDIDTSVVTGNRFSRKRPTGIGNLRNLRIDPRYGTDTVLRRRGVRTVGVARVVRIQRNTEM